MIVSIRQVPPDHPDVSRLLVQLGAHNAELHGHTDLDHTPPESWLCALVAYSGNTAVGLLGVCPADDTTVQMVRLFVQSEARGRGLTHRLALEAFEIARQAGYAVATWDTGADIPAVMNASSQLGAERIVPFGAHESDPQVRCFSLRLDASAVDGDTSGSRALARVLVEGLSAVRGRLRESGTRVWLEMQREGERA